MTGARSWHAETVAVTAGRSDVPGSPFNVAPTFASTFRDGGPHGYGRFGNPTWSAFEDALGDLEGGRALAFASGQAATAALLEPLPVGATILLSDTTYLGTRGYVLDMASRARLSARMVDLTDTVAALAALDGTDLLWLESPTNPLLGIVDLVTLAAAATERGIPTVVDNTLATPLLQRPLDLGATAVVHSATKFIGGHSDLLLGAVVTRDEELVGVLRTRRTLNGAIPGPMEAWLALRGLRTLPLRLEQAQRNAQTLAARLAGHPTVVRTRYPGLSGDPGHQIAQAQMLGPGAILSFELPDGESADAVVTRLRLIVSATSLGGVETTIDRRNRWTGEEMIPAGLLRLSVGIEHIDDLWNDLADALE